MNDFHVGFEYDHEKYELVKGEKSEHRVQINGVTYSILGPSEKMEEVSKTLNSISLASIFSTEDLKERLSSSGKIPSSSISEIKNLTKRKLPSTGPSPSKAEKSADGPSTTKKQFKAKEAEDLLQKKIPLKRTLSQSAVSGISSEKEEISKKTSNFWDCIGRIPDKNSNGYIYQFKLKPQFQIGPGVDEIEQNRRLEEAYDKMFPATEPTPMDVFYLFIGDTPGKEILNELGYSYKTNENGIFLNLPDRETLMSRWETLREKRPELPKLDIVSSEGIATDTDYLLAYFTHDALLSDGAEFVHDHDGHILEIITYILTSVAGPGKNPQKLNYQKDKAQMLKIMASFYKKMVMVERAIEENLLVGFYPKREIDRVRGELEKLKASLGVLADNTAGRGLSGFKTTAKAASNLKGDFGVGYREFLEKRFGSGTMSPSILTNDWNYVIGMEQWIRARQKALRNPSP